MVPVAPRPLHLHANQLQVPSTGPKCITCLPDAQYPPWPLGGSSLVSTDSDMRAKPCANTSGNIKVLGRFELKFQ